MGKKADGNVPSNNFFSKILKGIIFSILIYVLIAGVVSALTLSGKISEKSLSQIATILAFVSVLFGGMIGIGGGKDKRPSVGMCTAMGIILIRIIISAFSFEGQILGEVGISFIGCVALGGILASVIGAGKKKRA